MDAIICCACVFAPTYLATPCPEPPVHRAEGALNSIQRPAYSLVHGRLAHCQRLVILRLGHDEAFNLMLESAPRFSAES